MIFRRRKVEGEGAFEWSLATIRDIVEIVAIVAAGVWVFYTFVYENQIEPALSKPEVHRIPIARFCGGVADEARRLALQGGV